jgi:hypothetical protein
MKDFLLRVAAGLAGTLLLYRAQGLVGLALSAALWGPLMAKPIMEGFSESARRIRHSTQNRVGWDLYGVGIYEIRVQQVDGRPWIPAGDLLAALDVATNVLKHFDALEYDRIPDRVEWGLSEAGIRKLVKMTDTDHARRLALQLEREVFAPLRKRRESSAPPVARTE